MVHALTFVCISCIDSCQVANTLKGRLASSKILIGNGKWRWKWTIKIYHFLMSLDFGIYAMLYCDVCLCTKALKNFHPLKTWCLPILRIWAGQRGKCILKKSIYGTFLLFIQCCSLIRLYVRNWLVQGGQREYYMLSDQTAHTEDTVSNVCSNRRYPIMISENEK